MSWSHRGRGVRASASVVALGSAIGIVAAGADAGASCGDAWPTSASYYNGQTWDVRDDSWMAGDATNQVDLGDGRMLWLMGDTNWGTRNADGSYEPGWTMKTNSVFVQEGSCTKALRPFADFVKKSSGTDLYWPNDGWVYEDHVFITFSRIELTGTGTFGFVSDGMEVVRLDRSTLATEGRWPLPDPSRDWGSSVERVGDTLYWFGRAPSGRRGDPRTMHLARSTVGNVLEFRYRTATGWSISPSAAVPIHRRPTDSNVAFGTLPDGRWSASYKDSEFVGTAIEADVARNPWGPWAHLGPIAEAAPERDGELTYGGYVVPEIGWHEGTILVKWSHNSLVPGEVERGLVRYRPAFTSVPIGVFDDAEGHAALERERRFVVNAYREFLGRDPRTAEEDFWTNEMSFGIDRTRFTWALARSDEWLRYELDKMYRGALGRAADEGGLRYWSSYVRGGGRLTEVGSYLYASDEFYERSGGTDRGFVTGLYHALLGRAPDATGLRHWLQAMSRGLPRAGVTASFYGSIESRRSRVEALYRDLLGRGADAGGLAYWSEVLIEADDVLLAATLAASQEFHHRSQRV